MIDYYDEACYTRYWCDNGIFSLELNDDKQMVAGCIPDCMRYYDYNEKKRYETSTKREHTIPIKYQ